MSDPVPGSWRQGCQWISWERHQRSRSLAAELGIRLREIAVSGGRLTRYWRCGTRTLALLSPARGRPHTVFVQVPSIVLGVLTIVLRGPLRLRVIVDAHNAVFENALKFKGPAGGVYRWLVRKADGVIVTNEAVAAQARTLGGRPFVLPDPVPALEPAGAAPPSNNVVVISTWAEDEPLEAILQAAQWLPRQLQMTITGRPKGAAAELAARTPRVVAPGFLSDTAYVALLSSARVIVDLTTRDNCLVCGAYEALAVGRPLVVSDTRALRELLRDGAIYCENEPRAIADAIAQASAEEQGMAARCGARREAYRLEWQAALQGLLRDLSAAGMPETP